MPYTYAGYTGTVYANPDAPTQVGGIPYTYDQDGNTLTYGSTTNTWNYKDQLLTTTGPGMNSSYTYDYQGNRVSELAAGLTTYYPTKYYTITSTGKTDRQVYDGNTLVETIESPTVTGTQTPYYVHTDTVLGSNVITNAGGGKVQLLDYYPFGDIRINEDTSGFNDDHKYAGGIYDTSTSLNYLGARYYDAKTGQFLSEDPSFLDLGDPSRVQQDAKQNQNQYLMNPQALNSFSYANNNPINKIDPDGKIAGVDDAASFGIGAAVGAGIYMATSLPTRQFTWGGLAGATTSGGIIGWGADNALFTGGASVVAADVASASIYGGIGAAAGNGVTQGIDIETGKQQGGISTKDFGLDVGLGMFTGGLTQGMISDAEIPGLSSGRGNMNAIGESLQTKLANGTIENMSLTSAVKSAVGSQASDSYRTLAGAGIDLMSGLMINNIQKKSTN